MMHVSEAEETEEEADEEEAEEEEEEEEIASSSAAGGTNDKLETAGKAKVDGDEAAVAEVNADNEDTFETAVTVSADEVAVVFADSAVSLLASAAAAQTYFSIGSDSTIALRTSRSRCSICC